MDPRGQPARATSASTTESELERAATLGGRGEARQAVVSQLSPPATGLAYSRANGFQAGARG